jgi:hypothetical protein
MSEANKALVRRWFAEVDQGNPTIEEELLTPDYVDHDPPLPDMPPGREGVNAPMLYSAQRSPIRRIRSKTKLRKGTRS